MQLKKFRAPKQKIDEKPKKAKLIAVPKMPKKKKTSTLTMYGL